MDTERGQEQHPIPTSGATIRSFRLNERGVSASALAEEIGILKRTLLKAERDEGISVPSRKAIADWFDRQPEFAQVRVEVTSIWPELMEDDIEEAKAA